MSTGSRSRTIGFALGLSLAVLCGGILTPAHAAQAPHRKLAKAKAKKSELPPLPSGPTGPVQAMPLDSIAAVPPQVTFEHNELTIVAPNSTLADILRAVHKSTGADIDVPAAPERVVTRLGPGPARDVLADLLNGSRFNYVLLGAPGDQSALTRVVLVAKGANESVTPNQPPAPQPGMAQMSPTQQQPAEANPPDANDQGMVDDSNNVVDDNADQQPPAESAEQAPADQVPSPDQPQVKTPQQMLQEMQQRQMQLQTQQQPGQPPVPGSGVQPHPPQDK